MAETGRPARRTPSNAAPLGRTGRPEDVADVVGFLAGPRGRWTTGRTIDVSGGTYLGPPATG
ncbi:SDR family oxidoreductase [Streptomyces anulatus]|uniref:SDR family oxidoreductase n=1 Tax=Streptomyces anulatus TaxID=1892 RepID=UPI00255CFF99|nr:SDR family oxidoreductase [Streptomyces anulatus]WIY76202.1 SDR family oxidoreductase [Streptomyces anulatus]